jgi:hypothetical protein
MNPYKRLLSLLPQRPVLVGTVVSISNGVARIEMPGGGFDSARGQANVNDKVYFRDGQIEGPAPNLSVELIEV